MAAIIELIREYVSCAAETKSVGTTGKKAVRRYNALHDRMRAIVDEVVSLGQDAVSEFAIVLDKEPASSWAAHHLVEKADLDSAMLTKCFARVEREKAEAEAAGDLATAMGEGWWLEEWKAKKG